MVNLVTVLSDVLQASHTESSMIPLAAIDSNINFLNEFSKASDGNYRKIMYVKLGGQCKGFINFKWGEGEIERSFPSWIKPWYYNFEKYDLLHN